MREIKRLKKKVYWELFLGGTGQHCLIFLSCFVKEDEDSLRLWSLCQREGPRWNGELDEGFGLQGAQWGTLNHPWHEDTDSGSPLIPAATTRFCIPPLLPFLLSFHDLISSLFQPWAVQSLTAQSESLHVFALVHAHRPFHTFRDFYYISPVPSTSYLGNMKLNNGRSDDKDKNSHGDSRLYTELERVTEVYQKTTSFHFRRQCSRAEIKINE